MSLNPLNLDFEFEFEAPQSPLISPNHDGAQSEMDPFDAAFDLLNRLPAQQNEHYLTQQIADERLATPKRKRDADGDNSDDRDTPSKRNSPLQQVATPETLHRSLDEAHPDGGVSSQSQNLTPMKRSIHSFQKTTPVTLVKSVGRFQLDSHSSASSAGLADPFNLVSSKTPPQLATPRLIDFATASKPQASNKAGTRKTTPAVDVEVVGDGTGDENGISDTSGQFATPSTLRTSPTTPGSSLSASHSLPSSQTPTPSNPAPAPASTPAAPQEPLSALQKTPAIAPEYVPIYVSPDSPVKLRDSKQFCIKPPFWKRWPKSQYLALARYLQENIDLVPFAEQQGLTVEEVQHVYHAVVVEPLLEETDKLTIVSEKRMEKMFKTYDNAAGKTRRNWGDAESSVEADLGGVRPGIVQLTVKKGDMIEVPFRKLKEVDKEFVLSLLPDEERAILMREVV